MVRRFLLTTWFALLAAIAAAPFQPAAAAGHPETARQVAWALRGASEKGLPWQRVLGRGGRILLPGEAGQMQRTLLELEGVQFSGARVDMRKSSFFKTAPQRLRRSKI